MKSGMNFEEHKAMKEKRIKKLKSKDKEKYIDDDSSLEVINKKKPKATKVKGSEFRNNHKNFQYDYEEDLYEPNY